MISRKPERLFDRQKGAPANRSSDTRETYDERLNHVLAAATELMARVGYERASMRAVAKACGVSLAGLYHYFDSKEKMLFLVQFRTFNSLVSGVREKLHGVSEPIDQLRILVRAHVSYFAANMAALKVCSHELDSLSGEAFEETERLRREYYDLARGVVDRIMDAHAPGEAGDRYVATMSLFGMLNWLYRWYAPEQGHAPTTVANQITSQFLYGVLGEAGRRL